MDTFAGPHKALLTTTKDVTRLAPFRSVFEERNISVLVQPVGVRFLQDEEAFLNRIKRFIES
jgi:tetraacyldisaccharide-1-P 4'-kinase